MKVLLLEHTPNPERVVASAAKLCYSPVGVEQFSEQMSDEAVDKFVEKLMKMGHLSPLEHVSFTFAVEGVSRVLTHQLVRHRIASYTQQSQRYVKLDAFEYIVPPAIEAHPEAKALFEKAMAEDQRAYDDLVGLLMPTYTAAFKAEGYSEKRAAQAAEKKAIEDARFVFPNACETKIVFTMNARTLIHFFGHRCCMRAQWEIRRMADEMLKALKSVAPSLFALAGPNCISGPCPEGKMTCGKIEQVRNKYAGREGA